MTAALGRLYRELYGIHQRERPDVIDPALWWPMKRGTNPPEWERLVGAVVTINTSWPTAEKCMDRMRDQGMFDLSGISQAAETDLREPLASGGLKETKATGLKELTELIESKYSGSVQRFLQDVARDELLGIKGIGAQTADRILLYACGRKILPVDNHTARICCRTTSEEFITSPAKRAQQQKDVLQTRLQEEITPSDVATYQSVHAVFQVHGDVYCRANRPKCGLCPVSDCVYGSSERSDL